MSDSPAGKERSRMMNLRFLCLMLAAMTPLMSATALFAQTAARPDLSGIWSRTGPGAHQNFSQEAP
ncbi:MAG: hypothetical protein ACRD88_18350, partial [Terriglobia bacterium]